MVTRETDEGREYISEWRESPPLSPALIIMSLTSPHRNTECATTFGFG